MSTRSWIAATHFRLMVEETVNSTPFAILLALEPFSTQIYLDANMRGIYYRRQMKSMPPRSPRHVDTKQGDIRIPLLPQDRKHPDSSGIVYLEDEAVPTCRVSSTKYIARVYLFPLLVSAQCFPMDNVSNVYQLEQTRMNTETRRSRIPQQPLTKVMTCYDDGTAAYVASI